MADRACAAIVQAGQILLVHQSYRGRMIWTFPGGSVEPGETPMEAAVRETKEETTLQIAIVGVLCQMKRTQGTGRYFCYLGHILSGVTTRGYDPEEPVHAQELQEVRWFPLDEVREHPEVAQIWNALHVLLLRYPT